MPFEHAQVLWPATASRGTPRRELSPWPERHRTVLALLLAGGAVGLTAALVPILRDVAAVMLPDADGVTVGPAWYWAAGRELLAGYLALGLLPFLLCLLWRLLPPPAAPTRPYLPLASVVVPAFNEQDGIQTCITALLSQDYPLLEVLVVDDGSADLTAALVEGTPVRLVRMPANAGKAAALNAGLAAARGTVIVCSDGDSRLDRSAVSHLVAHFADPEVGAVAGRIVPEDGAGLLGAWQTIEYIFGQTIVKEAQLGAGGSVLLGPGPVTAFRRDMLLALGGFTDRTLAEDFDATLAVLAHGRRVAYEPAAVAYTDVPRDWRTLCRQRLRWSRGHLQVFHVWRDRVLRRGAGWAGNFWLPYYALVGIALPMLEPLLVLAVLGLFLAYPGLAFASLHGALGAAMLLELLTISQLALALAIAGERRPRLWLAALLSRPFMVVLAWTRLRAVLHALRGRARAW